MKKNDCILIAATAAYSLLFYQQNAGVNFLLFTILLIAIFLVRDKNLLKQHKWLWAASMALVSSACVFVHSSSLSILANCFSILLLSAFSVNVKTSSIFSILFSIYSILSAIVFVIIDAIARSESKTTENSNSKKWYKFLAAAIVFLLCILFFEMYKSANPLFAENTKWINFNFISVMWVLFTLSGFLIAYGIIKHRTIPSIETWENQLPNENKKEENSNWKRIEIERFAGILLFLFLNFMLIILNFGDITSIWFKAALPVGISHSDFVHNGVGVIILSLVIATSVLMYLYRGDFRSFKYSSSLKLLILLWIVQSLIMLFSTTCRNHIYVSSFNLTYKRIGVYVWLLLAAIGLVMVYFKIVKEKSNWYLIRKNFSVWLSVLVISATVNWDIIITRYNLSNKPFKDVDFYYLFSLSYSNIPELIEVTKDKDFRLINHKLRNFKSRYDRYYSEQYTQLLSNKIKNYLVNYNASWQSFDLRDYRINKSLIIKS